MLEGLPPHRPTHVMRLHTSERSARAMTDLLGEVFDPTETAVAAFEPEGGGPCLEAYFAREPDETAVRNLVRPIVGPQADAASFERLDPKDWVAASLEGLRPVRAGRFLVHGSHDRGIARFNDWALQIEAALAFGTGHHGSTRGCLLALDRIVKSRQPRSVLDIGTGTGVLAIAAARSLRRPVLASDIDRRAVTTARENARLNRARAYIEIVHRAGLRAQRFRQGAPFDLIFANILLEPLQQLATPMARLVARNGHVVLSGLLLSQAGPALASYRARGLVLVRRIRLEGWATLVLTRPRRI